MKRYLRGVAFGVFDGVHEGHKDFLRQAAALVEELYVLVARDKVCSILKGESPAFSQETRRVAVAALPEVTKALLGDETLSSYELLWKIHPDVICLGYDQKELEEDLRKRGVHAVRLEGYNPKVFHSSFLRS